MIVVAGDLFEGAGSGRMTTAIAGRAAGLGAAVEAVGVLPGDATGDRRLLELASRGIGHAAVLRTTAAGLEPADLELALRYLPNVGAIVLVEPPDNLIEPAVAAASWSGSGLVIVAARSEIEGLPPGALVLGPPGTDPDEAFAGLVAAVARRLDDGIAAAEAWRATTEDLGIEAAGGSLRG